MLTACILIGATFGCFLGVDFGNRFGRRVAFRITGAVCVITGVLLAFMPSFALIVMMRTLLGVSIGLVTALCPWYVNESVPAAIRGSIGTVFQINICAFIFVAEVVNFAFHPNASDTNIYLASWKWRLQLALVAAPGLMITVLSFIMHESPAYLASLADHEPLATGPESSKLSTMVPDHADIVLESGDSAFPVESHEKLGWGDLFSRQHFRWIFVGLVLAAVNQLTGINGVIFYAPKIFQDAGMANPLVMTFSVVGLWNLLSVFISFTFVDRLGRRPLMIASLGVMMLGAGLMSLSFLAFNEHNRVAPAIIAMILYIGAYECGPGPLFYVMAVEAFPASLRDPALGFTQAAGWIFAIIVSFAFPVLNSALGPAATFGLFALSCLLCGIAVWGLVPEPTTEKQGRERVPSFVEHDDNGVRVNSDPYQPL